MQAEDRLEVQPRTWASEVPGLHERVKKELGEERTLLPRAKTWRAVV